ncbi:MAG: BBP7 family outer membrane beta-barrel protein [Pirellulaceae bacterium]|nr:BBP7 family outer membrane beta-barrel protein [Pirellulaceae bacterium]
MGHSTTICCALLFALAADAAWAQSANSSMKTPATAAAGGAARVGAPTRRPSAVQPAAYQTPAAPQGTPLPAEMAPAPGERVYYEGQPGGDPAFGDFGLGGQHADYSSPGYCGPGCYSCGMFVRAEYLLWGLKSLDLPPLVSTSPQGTPFDEAGILGIDGTRILYGGQGVNSDVQSGGRLTLGWWIDPCRRLGVEGDYFALGEAKDTFNRSSTGDPILARPFYDVVEGQENALLVAFPGIIGGQIQAEATTTFQGAGVRAIYNLACGDGCGNGWITCGPSPTGYRFDCLVGYRFLRVDDRLTVRENSVAVDGGDTFLISDLFDTENQFHGVDLGARWSFCQGCWSVDILSKIALGNTTSRIRIDGSTTTIEDGDANTFSGGVLAQRTNIGNYEYDEFAVVPELGITLGYQINPCWRATLGYTFVYWSRVARAGDQIDRGLNTGLLPPEDDPVSTHLRPEFVLKYTDFWAQGMNVGLEASW